MKRRGGIRAALRGIALGAAAAAIALPAHAKITRIIIDRTTVSGGYETLVGRAFGELDPANPQNAIIQDLALGLDADGKARYIASFQLLRPVGANSGVLWHDVPNRGNRAGFPNSSRTDLDMQLNSAWQGDNAGNTAVPAYAASLVPVPSTTTVVTREWLKLPVARNADGTKVTGEVFGRIINRGGVQSQPLIVQSNPVPYPPASLDTTAARLVTRDAETMEGVATNEVEVPSTDWAWAKCPTGWASKVALNPGDLGEICMKNGFDAAKLYQVVYPASDAYVLGMGFAAFRDLGAFFRNRATDDFGNPNPLAGQVRWLISRGNSQSGNYLRGFLHLGFNQDEDGRQVHDGTWPIIAGRRIALNFRWAQPDGVLELYQAGSEGPQWWHKYPDQTRGLPPAGILDRCHATGTCPKVIEHFGSAEVWALKLTPEWVGTDPRNDIPIPDNVRRYYLPSSTHGGSTAGGTGGFNTPPPGTVNCPGNNYGRGILRTNPMPHVETVNALRYHFRQWVMNDVLPPDSRYPTLRGAKGERNLVAPDKESMGFPTIPVTVVGHAGWRTTAPEAGFINPVLDYDWGPQFDPSDATGVPTNVPPPIRQVIPMVVPRVDADGNELGGVPVVLNMAPLGTYLGWNITEAGFHRGQVCNYVGGMIPFAATKAARLASGDPRPSLEERYKDRAGYVNAVRRAAGIALSEGFLLQQDHDAIIAAAQASTVPLP